MPKHFIVGATIRVLIVFRCITTHSRQQAIAGFPLIVSPQKTELLGDGDAGFLEARSPRKKRQPDDGVSAERACSKRVGGIMPLQRGR